MAVAEQFSFVKIIREPRQGVVYARDHGFNVARGEIIGRIDADTILRPDWVGKVQKIFADPQIDAASGRLDYREVGLKAVFTAIDGFIRRYLARRMGRLHEQFLYGGNMAIRASAWQKVRSRVCHERHYHEDLDLAIHLSKLGRRVEFVPALRVSIAPRQAGASPRNFWEYAWSNHRIYVEHNMRSRRFIFRMVLAVLVLYAPMRLLYRGYDRKQQRFSFAYFFKTAPLPRVSPLAEPAA
jgi:cellulose synthase/poly-beta-1,6-N-acetylglucosamine synthase-like glycosyltransferase